MRSDVVRLAFAATLAAVASMAAADTLPTRKAGLWESKTAADGKMVARQCLDEKTDQLAQGAFGAGQACTKRSVVKTSTGYATEAECQIGPISAASKGTISGDFVSKLRIEADTIFTGMPNAKEPVRRTMVIEATYLGPCEAGQSPGDIIMPDGKVVKIPNPTR